MKILRNLLAAAFPESAAELDLHGKRVEEALSSVEKTLGEIAGNGGGRLRIICGKGKGSKGGRGVLREAVAGWLQARGYEGKFRRDVEFDGLDGAIIVEVKAANSTPDKKNSPPDAFS